jgi:hypothetical protein
VSCHGALEKWLAHETAGGNPQSETYSREGSNGCDDKSFSDEIGDSSDEILLTI